MAFSGFDPAAALQCGQCGARVAPDEPVCPRCGSHFETALCGRCGFRAARGEFVHARCPRCGHRADLGSHLFVPLAAAAAVLALVYLAFSLLK